MATQYDPTTFGWQNFYSAVLQSDITSGSLTLTLDTVPASTAGILVIEPDSSSNREVILYTSKGASTITCPADGRGWGGSTAVAHLTGSALIMADVASYFAGLSDGTLVSDAFRALAISNNVVSGGVVAQSAGLVGTFSNIVFYLGGRRYSGNSIANKTYTISKDTYVDITGNSDGSVTVLYTEVANAATAPALTTNYIRIAKVVTNASTITGVTQNPSSDGIGNIFLPKGTTGTTNIQNPYKFSVYLTTAQNVGTAATVVGFDTKNFDTGNNLDITTNKGRFTAPVAGFYQFNARVATTSAGTGTGVEIFLYKNGAVAALGDFASVGSGTSPAVSVSEVLQLAAGDFVDVRVATGTSAKAVDTSVAATNNGFSGFLVSST